MGSLITGAHRRFAGLIAELAKFGVVGVIAAVVDLGGAGYLHGVLGVGPLTAKAIAIAAWQVIRASWPAPTMATSGAFPVP